MFKTAASTLGHSAPTPTHTQAQDEEISNLLLLVDVDPQRILGPLHEQIVSHGIVLSWR